MPKIDLAKEVTAAELIKTTPFQDVLVVSTYLLYTILWEASIWGGGMYVIINYNWSPLTIIVLLLVSSTQITPAKWRALVTGVEPMKSESTKA